MISLICSRKYIKTNLLTIQSWATNHNLVVLSSHIDQTLTTSNLYRKWTITQCWPGVISKTSHLTLEQKGAVRARWWTLTISIKPLCSLRMQAKTTKCQRSTHNYTIKAVWEIHQGSRFNLSIFVSSTIPNWVQVTKTFLVAFTTLQIASTQSYLCQS